MWATTGMGAGLFVFLSYYTYKEEGVSGEEERPGKHEVVELNSKLFKHQ